MRIAEFIEGKIIYRDANPDEIAEFERQMTEMPDIEPTVEEQLADLSDYVDCLTEMVFGGVSDDD